MNRLILLIPGLLSAYADAPGQFWNQQLARKLYSPYIFPSSESIIFRLPQGGYIASASWKLCSMSGLHTPSASAAAISFSSCKYTKIKQANFKLHKMCVCAGAATLLRTTLRNLINSTIRSYSEIVPPFSEAYSSATFQVQPMKCPGTKIEKWNCLKDFITDVKDISILHSVLKRSVPSHTRFIFIFKVLNLKSSK